MGSAQNLLLQVPHHFCCLITSLTFLGILSFFPCTWQQCSGEDYLDGFLRGSFSFLFCKKKKRNLPNKSEEFFLFILLTS